MGGVLSTGTAPTPPPLTTLLTTPLPRRWLAFKSSTKPPANSKTFTPAASS